MQIDPHPIMKGGAYNKATTAAWCILVPALGTYAIYMSVDHSHRAAGFKK